MGIMDQAKDALENAKESVSGENLEATSDAILDKVAEAAKKVLGEGNAEKIDSIRNSIDEKIGE